MAKAAAVSSKSKPKIVKRTAPSRSTPKKEKPQTTRLAASPEDREHMIQLAAYHLAEKDGFQSGREHDYWLQAETQIDQLLHSRQNADKH